MKARITLVVMLAVVACGPPAPPPGLPAMQEPSPQALRDAATAFHTLREGFLEWYYDAHPVRASELGVHLHDDRLTAMDRSAFQRRIDAVLDWQADLMRIPIRMMRGEDRSDYAVLDFALRAELLQLEEVRRHAVDPRVYTDVIFRGVVAVAEGRHAPPAERVAALRSRLAAATAVLAAARENVRSPARISTELAIEETRALIDYLETELAAVLGATGAAGGAGDAALPTALEPARSELVAALREHTAWLENSLLPASTGEFRVGRYLFTRMLLYDAHVDLSVREMERLNQQRIADYRGQLETLAAEIDPARTPRQILDSIAGSPVEAVGPTAREMMVEARAWVRSADVVTVPRDELPEVRASMARGAAGATSLWAPGPFDEPAAAAVYRVALPRPDWPEGRQRQHAARLSGPALLAATLRETFPGDYVRRLHAANVPSELVRAFTPRTFVDGWAHYAEQMALDEGFRAGDAAVRLAHLQRSLHEQALWHASLSLHALGRPLDQVVEEVMEIAYLERESARQAVIRVSHDPLVLAAALGRAQIIELKETYERHQEELEEAFSLKEFHDRILAIALPLPLATEALMPSPSTAQPAGGRAPRNRPAPW